MTCVFEGLWLYKLGSSLLAAICVSDTHENPCLQHGLMSSMCVTNDMAFTFIIVFNVGLI